MNREPVPVEFLAKNEDFQKLQKIFEQRSNEFQQATIEGDGERADKAQESLRIFLTEAPIDKQAVQFLINNADEAIDMALKRSDVKQAEALAGSKKMLQDHLDLFERSEKLTSNSINKPN